jgi:hypothetical protein
MLKSGAAALDPAPPDATAVADTPAPTRLPQEHLGPDRYAPVFVWGIWALTLAAALTFVATYSSNVPFWSDEWIYVPVLTGNEPATPAWLWAWHNEHRIPLPKLIWWAAFRLTHDFRAVPVFSVLALGALSFVMIRAARSLRGCTSYADAFFPFVLLNGAQAYNLLFSIQVQMVSSTVLAGAVLVLIVTRGNALTLSAAFLVGLCLLLLPLCGSNGLILVPALALWLGYWAFRHWRSGAPHGKRNGLVTGALAGAALLLASVSVLGLPINPNDPRPTLEASLRTSLEFISGGLGDGISRMYWPASGQGVLSLMVLSALVLIVVGYRRAPERAQALGLLLFLAALGTLALGIGWGRATPNEGGGFDSRYVTLAAPAFCAVYFIWGLPAAPGIGRLVQMCLVTLACAAFAPNWQEGIAEGKNRRQQNVALENDILAETPCSLVAQRHSGTLCNSLPTEDVAELLQMLHDAGVGQFPHLKGDPVCREIPLTLEPIEVNQITWANGSGKGENKEACLVFALKRSQLLGKDPPLVYDLVGPLQVYAIRFKYAYEDAGKAASFRMSWGKSGRDDGGGADQSFSCELDRESGEQVKTIWVNDTVDHFYIYPDERPFIFKLLEITLLVPKAERDAVPPPLLRPAFTRARANEPITVVPCAGQPVLRIHAPSTVEFDVAARSRPSRISGKFGILPGAYGNPQDHTDGVQFAVEYTAEGKPPGVLFQKFLDPQARPNDRVMQTFAVTLPPGEKGTVVLKASNPPGKTDHRDWSYWTDVDIQGFLGTPLVTPFDRAQAEEPITVEDCDGKQVLRVHAPSWVEFDVPARPRRSRIAGRFGILPGAYGDPQDHTDGVQFAMEYTAEGQSAVVLFERFLNPQDNERDRGMQEFTVWLPPGEKGTVVLKAFNPPGKSQHLDWSYWTDVNVESILISTESQPQAGATESHHRELSRPVRAALAALASPGLTVAAVSKMTDALQP